MFKSDLQSKLKAIFGMRKVTFDAPGESDEQDTMFVEVADCKSRTTKGRAYAKVTGSLVVYAEHGKLPFGFFNKRIAQADWSLTKDLFFFDMDSEVPSNRLVDIAERRTGFVFLYSAQYDPNQGSIESVEFEATFEAGLLDLGDGTNLDIGDGKVLEV